LLWRLALAGLAATPIHLFEKSVDLSLRSARALDRLAWRPGGSLVLAVLLIVANEGVHDPYEENDYRKQPFPIHVHVLSTREILS
jgi:hypothetical protein